MEHIHISKKKPCYPIQPLLRKFLKHYGRDTLLHVSYDELLRFDNTIPLYDRTGKDTLWQSVLYSQSDFEHLAVALREIYALLKTGGEITEHLCVDRIDYCSFGNSKPFRIRIVNQFNDNHDYFYIKQADASRIYGLELEHILSPNRISYLVNLNTLVEEHIAGIPGDMFMQKQMLQKDINTIRLAKEFVKFNERCFVRLLGDMRAYNYVVDHTRFRRCPLPYTCHRFRFNKVMKDAKKCTCHNFLKKIILLWNCVLSTSMPNPPDNINWKNKY